MVDPGISHKTGEEGEYTPEGPVRSKDTDVLVMVFPPGQGPTDSTEYRSSFCNYLWAPRLVLTGPPGRGSVVLLHHQKIPLKRFLYPDSHPFLSCRRWSHVTSAGSLRHNLESHHTNSCISCSREREKNILRQICHHMFVTWGYSLSYSAV